MEKESRTFKKKPILVEVLLVILFIFAPFYFHLNIGGTGLNLPANILIWIVATSIIFLGVRQILFTRELFLPKYYYFILAFPVLITISGFITGVLYPLDWFFRLAFVWTGTAFFIALLQFKQTRADYDRYLFYIALSAMLQSITGFLHKYQVSFIKDFLPPSLNGDPFGTFFQINNQNTYQVTAILIVFYLLTRPFSHKSLVIKQSLYAMLFLAAVIIAISGSRIGALALLISLPLLICLLLPKLRLRKTQFTLAVIMLLVGIGLGGIQGNSELFDKTTRMSEGYGADERLGIYAISMSLIKKSPIWGHGIGSFIPKWHDEKIIFVSNDSQFKTINNYLTHPHNEVMFWAVEGGIIAISGFIFVIVFLLKSARSHYQQWPIVVLLIPIALHTQVELPFYTSALHWFVALLLLCVLSRKDLVRFTVTLTPVMHRTLNISNYLLTLLAGLFLSHTLISCYELGSYKGTSWNIETASNNPYYSNIVESMRYKELAIHANNAKDVNGTETFLKWGVSHMTKEPSPQMYSLMAIAYNNLKQKVLMCETADDGYKLYPDDKNIKLIHYKCIGKDVKNMVIN